MDALRVMSVIGVTGKTSVTRMVAIDLEKRLEDLGASVDRYDMGEEALPIFDVETSYAAPYYPGIRDRVVSADVYVMSTPDYHGCISSALKNFLDHFWREYAGKLFAPLVASYDKGLTVSDQIRTAARQCYAWSMPYAMSFQERRDASIEDGILNEVFDDRLSMFAQDILNYGGVLRDQRLRDLAGVTPGFLAKYRS